jgi:cysteinyl-tRNA synthetase
MSTHYRSPIDFSQERLNEAGVAYLRLRAPLERARSWDLEHAQTPGGGLGEAVAEADRLFHEAMDDDFNSARAIGHLFDLSREVNRALDDGLAEEGARGAGAMMRLGGILGLFWKKPAGEEWTADVLALVAEREAARKSRDWARADALRQQLAGLGLAVEDGPGGPRIKRLA